MDWITHEHGCSNTVIEIREPEFDGSDWRELLYCSECGEKWLGDIVEMNPALDTPEAQAASLERQHTAARAAERRFNALYGFLFEDEKAPPAAPSLSASSSSEAARVALAISETYRALRALEAIPALAPAAKAAITALEQELAKAANAGNESNK